MVKSILKPTIPLTPPKPIPPHASARKRSPGKSTRSPSKQIPPSSLNDSSSLSGAPQDGGIAIAGADKLANPFEASFAIAQQEQDMRVPLRTEEEQQAAAEEREETERRELEKKDILERRDARRKSLGIDSTTAFS